MAKIPEQPKLTPEQAMAALANWFTQSQQLAALRAAEAPARQQVANYFIPEPEEGTNRVDIGGGYDLKLDHKLNRTVDEAALLAVTAQQAQALGLDFTALFRWKPELNIGAYRTLTPAQRDFVDGLLDIKIGLPALSVVPKADTAGQAAHVAAAEAAAAPSAPQLPINTGKEDATEVGQYFKDGGGVWWLLGEDEWEQVEDESLLSALEAQVKASKPKRGRRAGAKKGA